MRHSTRSAETKFKAVFRIRHKSRDKIFDRITLFLEVSDRLRGLE